MYIFLFYEKEGFLVSLRKGVDTRDTRHRRDSFGSTLNKKIQTKEYKSMIKYWNTYHQSCMQLEKCFPHCSPYSWPHIRQLILQWYLPSLQPSVLNSLLYAASRHSIGTRQTRFHMCVFVQTVSSSYTAGPTRAAGYCCNAWSHGALAHDLQC